MRHPELLELPCLRVSTPFHILLKHIFLSIHYFIRFYIQSFAYCLWGAQNVINAKVFNWRVFNTIERPKQKANLKRCDPKRKRNGKWKVRKTGKEILPHFSFKLSFFIGRLQKQFIIQGNQLHANTNYNFHPQLNVCERLKHFSTNWYALTVCLPTQCYVLSWGNKFTVREPFPCNFHFHLLIVFEHRPPPTRRVKNLSINQSACGVEEEECKRRI